MSSMDALAYNSINPPNVFTNLKMVLKECRGLCSSFNADLPTNYRHERCERSVHMRLYSMSKRHFALIFLFVQLSLMSLIILGLKSPQVTEEFIYNVTEFNSSEFSLQSGPFVMKSPLVNLFNQQLWLHMFYSIEHPKGERFEVKLKLQVRWSGVEMQMKEVSRGALQEHSKTLSCSAETCDELALAHFAYLLHPYYTFNVRVSGLESLQLKINDVRFKFTTVRPQYTQLQIWFRFFFLILSFITTCSFAYSLRRFSLRNWALEQKWLSLLLPLLILYNNPIYALSFLTASPIPATVDIFLQASFLCCLFLFYLCIYHGLRQVQRKFVYFYLPKLLLVCCLCFCVCFLSSWQRFKHLNDPTSGGDYLNLKVLVGVLGALYCLKLTYLITRAFAELRKMPYFDLRLKMMTSLLAGMVLLSIIIIAIRPSQYQIFGVGFYPSMAAFPASSVEFVVLYGGINVLITIMAVVYSPSENAFYESHFKDNPALSMLNESEDDVIYGEEISLTTNRPARQFNRNISDEEDDAFN